MSWTERELAAGLRKAARAFPALMLTGPRRSGKTSLLRRLFPQADYVLLEDPDVVGRVRADPRAFLDGLRRPALLDEIQNAPELLNYVRTRIDEAPRRMGQWLLTGSQEAPLMRGGTESMAGRVALFQLLPFSCSEHPKVGLLRGGFPEVLARPSARQTWYRSYVQTYLERDVRAVSSIRDLAVFRRFMALAASRCGQLLNRTEFSAALGVSVPTVSEWLSILEITGQILPVPPFYENFGKRLVKSPKLYFADTGLAAHLLGIETDAQLERSPFGGPLFESFVASEIVKQQVHAGRARALYWFRDRQGLEVDFLVPQGAGRLLLLEAKATRAPRPRLADALLRLDRAVAGRRRRRRCLVITPAAAEPARPAPLCPGVTWLPVNHLKAVL